MREATARPLDLDVLGWIKAREKKILMVTAAVQLLILVAMIAVRAMPLMTGQTVLVRVVPVDPRDLFRGDYVRLSYDFSRIPPEGIEGVAGGQYGEAWRKNGRTIYAPLLPDADRVHWRAEKISVTKPETGLFLKGQVGPYGTLVFGIESYYLQEGTGHTYERAIRDRKLSAELAVSSTGQAALRGLRIE